MIDAKHSTDPISQFVQTVKAPIIDQRKTSFNAQLWLFPVKSLTKRVNKNEIYFVSLKEKNTHKYLQCPRRGKTFQF